MGRPNVNWNVGIAAEKHSTYTSKAVKAGIPFASQVTEPNTKYIIKYDFSLGGEEVTIPEDCILEFDGGSLNGDKIHTLTLNGASIVSKGGIIFRNVVIESEPGLELYTSWFEWTSTNAEEQFVSIVSSVNNYGILHVDNMLTFRKPIVLPPSTGTTITGSIPNRVAAKKYGIHFIYSEDAENGLINWEQEACSFDNLSFTHEPEENTTVWSKHISMFKVSPRYENAADLDINFNNCTIIQKCYYHVILAYGRGLKIQNCLIHRSTDNGNEAIIRLEGKGSQTGDWLVSNIAGRGVFVTNNRIHGNGAAPLLELVQNPNDTDWTYINVMITNNQCDLGTHVFKSSSKVRGVFIEGNTFVRKGNSKSIISISNTAEQISFSNNIINKNDTVDGRNSNTTFLEIVLQEGMSVNGVRLCNNEIQCRVGKLIGISGEYENGTVPVKDIQIIGNRCSIAIILDSVVPAECLQISDNRFYIAIAGEWSLVNLKPDSKNVVFTNNIINGIGASKGALVRIAQSDTDVFEGIDISSNIVNIAIATLLVLAGAKDTYYPSGKHIKIQNNILGSLVFTSTASQHRAIFVVENTDLDDVQIIGNSSTNEADAVLKGTGDNVGRVTENVRVVGNTGISIPVYGNLGATQTNIECDYNHGTTRPSLTEEKVGYCFVDETLGKPIWYTGNTEGTNTGWIDATGSYV